jgi:DNA-directed RNA polymerase subunit RPC12/RpoP
MAEVRPIDANELLGLYKNWLPQLTADEDAGDRNGVETCIVVLEDAPTLDYTPVRHGEWVQRSYFDECENVYTCSACEFDLTLIDGTPKDNRMIYCPSCGAKMDGGKNND